MTRKNMPHRKMARRLSALDRLSRQLEGQVVHHKTLVAARREGRVSRNQASAHDQTIQQIASAIVHMRIDKDRLTKICGLVP